MRQSSEQSALHGHMTFPPHDIMYTYDYHKHVADLCCTECSLHNKWIIGDTFSTKAQISPTLELYMLVP